MFLAKPDREKNTSEVLISFEEAFDIIKSVDNITQGITKIVYLVGRQGFGHETVFLRWKLSTHILSVIATNRRRTATCGFTRKQKNITPL